MRLDVRECGSAPAIGRLLTPIRPRRLAPPQPLRFAAPRPRRPTPPRPLRLLLHGPRRLLSSPLLALLLSAFLVPLTACDLPRDPVGTLERVRGDTLRVGVVASPPYLVRTGEVAGGPEGELVRAFAARIDAEVEWRWGSLDEHMKALESFELDLVAAGLTMTSPWKKKVGLTRPWEVEGKRKQVLAVPPGENGMLVALEALIEERRRQGR